MNQSRKYNNK